MLRRKIKQGGGRSGKVGSCDLSGVTTKGLVGKDLKEERSHLDT